MSFFTQVKIKFLIIHYPCHLLLLPHRCLVLGIANHNLCNLQEELNIDIVKNRQEPPANTLQVGDYISILMELLD